MRHPPQLGPLSTLVRGAHEPASSAHETASPGLTTPPAGDPSPASPAPEGSSIPVEMSASLGLIPAPASGFARANSSAVTKRLSWASQAGSSAENAARPAISTFCAVHLVVLCPVSIGFSIRTPLFIIVDFKVCIRRGGPVDKEPTPQVSLHVQRLNGRLSHVNSGRLHDGRNVSLPEPLTRPRSQRLAIDTTADSRIPGCSSGGPRLRPTKIGSNASTGSMGRSAPVTSSCLGVHGPQPAVRDKGSRGAPGNSVRHPACTEFRVRVGSDRIGACAVRITPNLRT
jgi:hypothetical protein